MSVENANFAGQGDQLGEEEINALKYLWKKNVPHKIKLFGPR